MSDDTDPEDVARRAAAALADATAIDYGGGYPDKQYPEIRWSLYGLPYTDEIVVVAEVGNLRLGIAALSDVAFPSMFDRTIAGIDIRDRQLSFALADELWAAHSERLIAEVMRVHSH